MITAIVLGVVLGLYVLSFIIPLIPGLIPALVIKPNANMPHEDREDIKARDYPKGSFGFFTFLYPGQVKVIERGGKFIRCIMAFPHHMFAGERTDNDYTIEQAEYWEVVKTADGFRDSHPIPFPNHKSLWRALLWLMYFPISIAWWVWKRWVYLVTGAVFVGIPPFQGLKIYPMERFRRVTQSSGEIKLVRKEDWSDHYRVAHFQYPAKIGRADTQDMVPVDVIINVIAQVFNPYMVAYFTDDDWPTRLLGSISNRITEFTRARPLDTVWTAKNADASKELAEYVTAGGRHRPPPPALEGSTCEFGIKILESQVLDISPTDPADVEPLEGLARARVQRQADEELARGRAAYIREEGAALEQYPKSDIVVNAEAMVRAAEAVGKAGGTVFLGGMNISPAEAAQLKLLKDIATKGTA